MSSDSESDCTSKWVDNGNFANECEEFDKLKCKEFDYVAKQQHFGKKLTRVKGNRGCEIEQSKKIKVWTGKPKNENVSDLEDEESSSDESPKVAKKTPQKGIKRKSKKPMRRKPSSAPIKKINVVPVITEPMTQSKHPKIYALQTPEKEKVLTTKSVLKPIIELVEESPPQPKSIVTKPSEEPKVTAIVLDKSTKENAGVVVEYPKTDRAIPVIEVEKAKTKTRNKPEKTVLVAKPEDLTQNAPLTAVVYDSKGKTNLVPVVELPEVDENHIPVVEVKKPKTKTLVTPVELVVQSKTKSRATPVELVVQSNKKTNRASTKIPTELMYLTPQDLTREYGPENLSFRKRLQPVKKDKNKTKVYIGPENMSFRKRLQPVKKDKKKTKVYMGPENMSFRKRLKPVKKDTNVGKVYIGPENLSLRKRLQPVKTVLVTKPEVPKPSAPLTAVVLDSDDNANLVSIVEFPKTEKTKKKNIPVIEVIEEPKTKKRTTPLELVIQPDKKSVNISPEIPTRVISLQPSQELVSIAEIEKPKTKLKTPVTIAVQSNGTSPQKTVKLVSLKSPPPHQVQLRELGPENLSLRKRLKPVKEEEDVEKLYFGPENLSFRKRLQPVKTLLVTKPKTTTKQKSPAPVTLVVEPEAPKADYVTLQTVPVVNTEKPKSKTPITIALQPTESSEEISPQKSVKLVSLKPSIPPPPPLPAAEIVIAPSNTSAEQPREQTLIIAPENLSLRKRLKTVEKAPTTNKIYFGPDDLVWRDRLKPTTKTVTYLPVAGADAYDQPEVDTVVVNPEIVELEEPKQTTVYALTPSEENVYTVKPEKEKTYVLKTNEKPTTSNKVYFGPEDKPWRDRLQAGTRTRNVILEPVVEVEEEPAGEKTRRSSKITRMVNKVKKAVDALREEEMGTARTIKKAPHREARGVKPATHFGPEIRDVRIVRKN